MRHTAATCGDRLAIGVCHGLSHIKSCESGRATTGAARRGAGLTPWTCLAQSAVVDHARRRLLLRWASTKVEVCAVVCGVCRGSCACGCGSTVSSSRVCPVPFFRSEAVQQVVVWVWVAARSPPRDSEEGAESAVLTAARTTPRGGGGEPCFSRRCIAQCRSHVQLRMIDATTCGDCNREGLVDARQRGTATTPARQPRTHSTHKPSTLAHGTR